MVVESSPRERLGILGLSETHLSGQAASEYKNEEKFLNQQNAVFGVYQVPFHNFSFGLDYLHLTISHLLSLFQHKLVTKCAVLLYLLVFLPNYQDLIIIFFLVNEGL